jgi:hypothetical protein
MIAQRGERGAKVPGWSTVKIWIGRIEKSEQKPVGD